MTKRSMNEHHHSPSALALGLGVAVFLITAMVETALFFAVIFTGLIAYTKHSADMTKSCVAFALCLFAVPMLAQLVVDQLTDDGREPLPSRRLPASIDRTDSSDEHCDQEEETSCPT